MARVVFRVGCEGEVRASRELQVIRLLSSPLQNPGTNQPSLPIFPPQQPERPRARARARSHNPDAQPRIHIRNNHFRLRLNRIARQSPITASNATSRRSPTASPISWYLPPNPICPTTIPLGLHTVARTLTLSRNHPVALTAEELKRLAKDSAPPSQSTPLSQSGGCLPSNTHKDLTSISDERFILSN